MAITVDEDLSDDPIRRNRALLRRQKAFRSNINRMESNDPYSRGLFIGVSSTSNNAGITIFSPKSRTMMEDAEVINAVNVIMLKMQLVERDKDLLKEIIESDPANP